MPIRFIKEKIYQIFLVIMTLAFIGMSIFSIMKVLQVHDLQRQLYGCKNTHIESYTQSQAKADNKSVDYETIRTENQVTNNVIEKRLETVIQKEPVIFHTDCVTPDSLSELDKYYDSFPTSEPVPAVSETKPAGGDKGS